MNAYEVSKPIATGAVDGFRFGFGVDNAKVAAQLRKLANAIEASHEMVLLADDQRMPLISVERLSVETIADKDDFTLTKITMTIAERIKTP